MQIHAAICRAISVSCCAFVLVGGMLLLQPIGVGVAQDTPKREVCFPDAKLCVDPELLEAHFEQLVFGAGAGLSQDVARSSGLDKLRKIGPQWSHFSLAADDGEYDVIEDEFVEIITILTSAYSGFQPLGAKADALTGLYIRIADYPTLLSEFKRDFAIAPNFLQRERLVRNFEKLKNISEQMDECFFFQLFYYIDSPSGGQQIGLSIVFVENQGDYEYCFLSGVMRAIGLDGYDRSIPSTVPTIFDKKGDRKISAYDVGATSILYNDRLVPGMTKDEAMPVVRQIISSMPSGF